MLTYATVVALILAALIAVQSFLAAVFIARLRRAPVAPLSDSACPKAALIICVRGRDSTLADCLNAALKQDYPDYALHIIVDSKTDPAWPLVEKLVAANPDIPCTVQVLTNPLTSCSLKCSSLIQGISKLDTSYEVVALLDTDIIPHRSWLRDMVAPLTDPKVGATTGNRWFAPSPPSWPNLYRYAWNAAAIVLMYWLGIAWGGSMAIKRSVINEGHVLSDWSRTYGEDTAINPALRRLGLRLEFVSSALITERGSCDVSQFLNWVTRQLLSCRLHHQGWKLVLLHGMASCVALGLAVLLVLAGLVLGYTDMLVLTGTALAVFFLALFCLLIILELSIRGSSCLRNRAARSVLQPVTTCKLMLAVVLTQALYAYVLFKAATARTVEWRRARYEILEGGRIRLVEYCPFPDSTAPIITKAFCTSAPRGS